MRRGRTVLLHKLQAVWPPSPWHKILWRRNKNWRVWLLQDWRTWPAGMWWGVDFWPPPSPVHQQSRAGAMFQSEILLYTIFLVLDIGWVFAWCAHIRLTYSCVVLKALACTLPCLCVQACFRLARHFCRFPERLWSLLSDYFFWLSTPAFPFCKVCNALQPPLLGLRYLKFDGVSSR